MFLTSFMLMVHESWDRKAGAQICPFLIQLKQGNAVMMVYRICSTTASKLEIEQS